MMKLLAKLRTRNIGKATAEKYEQAIQQSDQDIAILKGTLDEFETKYGRHQITYDLFGSFIFLRLSFKDILTIEKYIKTVSTPADRHLFGRVLAMLLYELLEDMGQVLGKRYNAFLKDTPFEKEINAELNHLRTWYNAAKKQVMPVVKDIRHNIIAHKDHDALKQLEALAKMDVGEIEILSAVVQMVYLKYITFEKKFRKAMLQEMRKQPPHQNNPSANPK